MIRRLPIIILIGALAAVGGWADLDPRSVDLIADPIGGDVLPVSGRQGSPPVWYCPTLRLSEVPLDDGETSGISAEGRLILTNPAPSPASARITVRGPSSPPAVSSLAVPGRSVVEIPAADLGTDPTLAAVVESDSDRLVVARELVGVTGTDIAPCTDRISDDWYLADGSTSVDADLVYVIFNPLSEDAVVDLDIVTDAEVGIVAGASLDGIVIPAGRVRPINVGQLVRRRNSVSARIVVRSGRVSVDRAVSRDGSAGPGGLSVSPGVLAAAETWFVPGGRLEVGVTETVVIHNPGERAAEIDIEVQAPTAPVEPQTRTVPAEEAISVPLDAATFGLDVGVDHSILVRSLTGVPVVVDVGVAAVGGAESVDGLVIPGSIDSGPGATVAEREWVVPLAVNGPEGASTIVIATPFGQPANADVLAFVDGDLVRVATLTVPAAGESRLVLDQVTAERFALVVRADQPIVVGSGGPSPAPMSRGFSIAVPVEGDLPEAAEA